MSEKKTENLDFTPVRIGKYVLLDRIASGGMADIFRAKISGSSGFEKSIAVKKMLPHTITNDELKEMFKFEAKLCSLLNHPNIIQVYDFVQLGKDYMLTMEFIDGKTLRQILAKLEQKKRIRKKLKKKIKTIQINRKK